MKTFPSPFMNVLTSKFIVVSFLVVVFFTSCKKDAADKDPQTTGSNALLEDKLKDTALLYSKDLYLWYKQIPSSFKARGYKDLPELMTALRQYSRESNFPEPVDRWSFAIKKAEWDNVSTGISGDFGLDVFFNDENDLRIKSVERSSPAGLAGIRRGWRITAINGSTNINPDNTSFIVDNVFYSAATDFKFTKPDGSTISISLKAATYQEHPVFLDTVYNYGGKRIGYFVFNSFLGDTTETYNRFQQTFSRFSNENVSDVVVDLRYNGGGYVSVQNKLANYLAPQAANGGVMMKQEFNDKFTEYNSTDYFKKLGSLNLSRIFFIVSKSTASASELLINNLKPYMEVVLIGPNSTYGKPVGYFPLEVGDWNIFPVSFRSINKKNEGNYYNGISVHSQVKDGLDKDWGDLQEACLARAVRYITTGSFQTGIEGREKEQFKEQPRVNAGNQALDQPSFKGMVDTRGL